MTMNKTSIRRNDEPIYEIQNAVKFMVFATELHKSFSELTVAEGSRHVRWLRIPEAELSQMQQWTTMDELIKRSREEGHDDVITIITTHSEIVLNAFRLAAHAGVLRPEQVIFAFLPEKHGMTHFRCDQDGRIADWPKGFFDTHDMQLDALLRPSMASIRAPAAVPADEK